MHPRGNKGKSTFQQTREVETSPDLNEIPSNNTINSDEVIAFELENDILNTTIAWRKGI